MLFQTEISYCKLSAVKTANRDLKPDVLRSERGMGVLYTRTSNGRRLKYKPTSEERTNIYDRSGHQKGYLKPDALFENRTNIHAKNGRQKGYLKPDVLFDDWTNIYKSD